MATSFQSINRATAGHCRAFGPVDSGELHAEIEALRGQLLYMERERDASRARAEHLAQRYRQTG